MPQACPSTITTPSFHQNYEAYYWFQWVLGFFEVFVYVYGVDLVKCSERKFEWDP